MATSTPSGVLVPQALAQPPPPTTAVIDTATSSSTDVSSRSTSSRFPTVSSAAAAALGAAAATLRLFGMLSDSTLPRRQTKGKETARDGYDSDSSDSSSSSAGSVDLIQGVRRSRRKDYQSGFPQAGAVEGLAAYDLPMPVVSAYCKQRSFSF